MAKLELILSLTDKVFFLLERIKRVGAMSEEEAAAVMAQGEEKRDALIDAVTLP